MLWMWNRDKYAISLRYPGRSCGPLWKRCFLEWCDDDGCLRAHRVVANLRSKRRFRIYPPGPNVPTYRQMSAYVRGINLGFVARRARNSPCASVVTTGQGAKDPETAVEWATEVARTNVSKKREKRVLSRPVGL